MISRNFAIFISIVIFFVCIVMILLQDGQSESLLGKSLLLSSVLFIIPFIIKDEKRLSSYMFRPFIVFLMGYFIVFFQKYYDLYCGLTSKDDSVFWNSNLIVYSLLLSCLGLAAFLIGYYSSAYRGKKRKIMHHGFLI